MPKRRPLTIDEELQHAFGHSLVQALATTYSDWRGANARKCQAKDVAQALLYFCAGSLAEMGVASELPARGHWESFVCDSQRTLADAMAFCRGEMERLRRGS
jgi:hypothetical protein